MSKTPREMKLNYSSSIKDKELKPLSTQKIQNERFNSRDSFSFSKPVGLNDLRRLSSFASNSGAKRITTPEKQSADNRKTIGDPASITHVGSTDELGSRESPIPVRLLNTTGAMQRPQTAVLKNNKSSTVRNLMKELQLESRKSLEELTKDINESPWLHKIDEVVKKKIHHKPSKNSIAEQYNQFATMQAGSARQAKPKKKLRKVMLKTMVNPNFTDKPKYNMISIYNAYGEGFTYPHLWQAGTEKPKKKHKRNKKITYKLMKKTFDNIKETRNLERPQTVYTTIQI